MVPLFQQLVPSPQSSPDDDDKVAGGVGNSNNNKNSKHGTVAANLVASDAVVGNVDRDEISNNAADGDGDGDSSATNVMLFVDGTWLYYSIHERPADACPLVRRYGREWRVHYDIDWAALPGILATALQQQLLQQHKSRTAQLQQTVKKIELVRCSVYTSYKADTRQDSNRYKLFQDLQAANFQVHMMETVGKSEKCVDIQLAVELLHYATTTTTTTHDVNRLGVADNNNSFDVALILTGDKDFMPAMIRTRQKGKKVGLVSMRNGCNRALTDTAGLVDFDVIWLEDYLKTLVVPKANCADGILSETRTTPRNGSTATDAASGVISDFTLHKVIHDFCKSSGVARVSSRDLGRYLKYLRLGGSTIRDLMKQYYGGLIQFLTSCDAYYEIKRDSFTEHSYWISLTEFANALLLQEAAETKFSAEEKIFFDRYSVKLLLQNRQRMYGHTLLQTQSSKKKNIRDLNDDEISTTESSSHHSKQLPELLTRDYSFCLARELKDACRKFGLPVSGTKPVMLERIQQYVDGQVALWKAQDEKTNSDLRRLPLERRNDNYLPMVEESVAAYLKGLMEEYLHAKGGIAGSRDVGRYLAANKSSSSSVQRPFQKSSSALVELKKAYNSLNSFVVCCPDSFYIQPGSGNEKSAKYEFRIALLNGKDGLLKD